MNLLPRRLRHVLAVSFLLLLLAPAARSQDTLRFQVNTRQARSYISPYVYGVNDNYARATARRLGGNRLTSYNWEHNASNAGHDYIHHSDDYVPWQQGVPDSLMSRAGSALRYFHDRSIAQGAYSLVTLPMAGYVAADKGGTVSAADAAPSSRWKEVRVRKGAPLSLAPDLTDSFVYVEEELNFLLQQYGLSGSPTGIHGYSLDNEPCLWFSTHPRLFGETHVAVDTLLRRSVALARLIKEMDPGAEVFGPALYGYNAYLDLQQAPDWAAHNVDYDMFVQYYLAEMRRQDSIGGQRLLDVLDLHWYPEYNFTSRSSPFGDGTDPATNKARMDMPRSLWDSTYVENTWIGNGHQARILPVLPKLRSYISQYYPGTKLALTEYSYMGGNHPSGGVAQADALGTFGRQGLYMANYWGAVNNYIKAGFDLFVDYNGQGGRFGDSTVTASTSNIEYSSVYASVEAGNDGKVHVVVLNKDQNFPRAATFTIASDVEFHGARVWAFDGSGSTLRQLPDVRQVTNNSFTYTLPPMSGLHFVLTEEDLSKHPFIERSSVSPGGGYSDGGATAHITARISDGDNNLTSVTVNLSGLGGSAATPLQQVGDSFFVSYTIPAGTASGLKPLLLTATDADGHTAQATLYFRVIGKVPPKKIWDGDLLNAGENTLFYDPGDSHDGLLVNEKRTSGGNEEPGALYLRMGHDPWRWNLMCFRFAPNAAQPTDISEYEFLEFYIRGTAGAGTDIEVSLQDCSAGQNNSKPVKLKGDGYLVNLSGTAYTRVLIPLSAFTDGVPFDLARTWQINFLTNTAAGPFDLWVDDLRALPYSNPLHLPVIRSLTVTPDATYADGQTQVTLRAVVADPDADIAAVQVDLSALNGSNRLALTGTDSIYTATYAIPALASSGTLRLFVSARDSANNEARASVPFTIHRVASTDTIWNGDSKPFGAAWVNNVNTSCVLSDTGGYARPGSLKLRMMPHLPNTGWSGVVWDWNENTGNMNLQDGSDKRYLSFYMRVSGAQPGLELEVSLKDVNAEPSAAVRLIADGYLTSFTGGWQRVQIPMTAIVGSSEIDPSKLARFVLISNFPPPAGMDVYIDDITFSGSRVADVALTRTDPACGDNGSIHVDSVAGGSGPYQYFLDGAARGATMSNLAPGTYRVKLTGPGGFIYSEEVTLTGSRALGAQAVVAGTDVQVQLAQGTGPFGYAWSNGATTPALLNAAPGTYTVTVTDSSSGCTATAQAVVGGTLPLRLLSFGASPAGDDVQVAWRTAEEDVQYFEVLHSLDGQSFAALERVTPGAGAVRSYGYRHEAPGRGVHYYRLRWREPSGRDALSPVRRVLLGGTESPVQLAPNPAREAVDVRSGAPIERAWITGSDGRQWPCTLPAGGGRLDLRHLPAGAYVLTVQVEGSLYPLRFSKL